MNSPRQQELDKLQKIRTQVQQVQQRIEERLPVQHANMTSVVCAWKWRLQTLHSRKSEAYTQDLLDSTVKKLRMDVGVFEYGTKEQGELLTRCLFQLDDILSYGNPEIKDARKALVLSIQELLERADALKAKATKLKAFTERVIDRFPVVSAEDTGLIPEEQVEPAEAMDTQEENSGPIPEIQDQLSGDAQDNDMEGDEDEEYEEEEEEEEDAKEDDEEQEEEEEEEEEAMEVENEGENEEELPVWKPYYQLQKRPDGVYLLANLHGIDADNLRVEVIPQDGVLRISGVKYPTQKDLMLSHLSGVPTFGRFEIVERFPSHLLALAKTSQQIRRDGTLQVRVPYACVPRQRVVRRVSPFQPHRLAVW